jgi:iron(III) transport system ATP-binding protein
MIALERVLVPGRLGGVSLSVGDERVVVVGPSGAGKSTLLRVVLGLEPLAGGVVRIDGRLASDGSRRLLAPEERGVAMVFQDLALWPHLDVAANLAFALRARGVPRGERDRRVREALSQVRLDGFEARHPGELSGGERQRVAIARALVTDPVALLLDEPLANLDVVCKQELLALLAEVTRDRRLPTLHVTHDPAEAAALGDRIAVLEGGALAQVGTADQLAAEPATPFVEALASAWRGRR